MIVYSCFIRNLFELAAHLAFVAVLFSYQRAVDALLRLPQSEARDALVRLTHAVITRKK